MQWRTEYVQFHEAENSRQKERHKQMSDVQMFWSSCAECARVLESEEEQSCLEGEYTRRRLDRYYDEVETMSTLSI